MCLKKVGVALIPVVVLSVVAAQIASAANFETSKGFWYVNGSKLAQGSANGKHAKCEVDPGTVIGLTTTVGKNNVPLKFQATGIACPEGEIFNESEEAKFRGKIKLTGMTVVEPAGCTVAGGTVQTNTVKGSVGMKKGSSSIDTVVFEPAVGEEFAEITIEGCTLSGGYALKGVIYGQPTNETCVEAEKQTVDFSKEIEEGAGGVLTFLGHGTQITGELSLSLEGGGKFGICSS